MQQFQLTPIAFIETPFREKFAIPRQAGIVSAAKGRIILQGRAADPSCFDKLDGYSHLWLTWVFHAVPEGQWQPRVRPPRLGGNVRVGVFASRSPFRPNPIGLSVVKLESINVENGKTILEVSGVDMIDGTPILDIKPYLPYSDAIGDAVSGFATQKPEPLLDVSFSPDARHQLDAREDNASVEQVIRGILSLDPRPAYRRDEKEGEYGILLYDFNLRWRVRGKVAEVIELDQSSRLPGDEKSSKSR